jgi:LysR family transcriptional regulator, cys regulon transcriptional activator
VAVRRGAYLRGYAHAFINMFAPHLSRDTVSTALAEASSRLAVAA